MSVTAKKEWNGESGYCNCLLVAMARVPRVAQQHGASTIFEDHPVRDLKGLNPVIWHAELSLVGIKNNGAVDVLKSFSYGFTLTNGGVILEPLKEK